MDKDQIKPFHAKEASTGQEMADVLSAVLKHAAERDVAAKKKTAAKPQPIWMLPLGLTLSVLAGFLIVAPPAWVVVNPIAAQAPEDQMQNVRAAIVLYGTKIENYRSTEGRLPQTLAEAGVTVTGIDYTLQGGGYVLAATLGDRDVVFNSTVESLRDWGLREVVNLGISG
ncbi:MAG: hypothetical protein EXR91_05665 [Gemmatimonadetes bacterium]|nr:hypothetical protein [Gemmatimonadota bacterium]